MTEPVTPSPASPPAPGARKPGRGLRVALVLSVMLNLLVVGVLAGGALRGPHFAPPGMPGQPDIRALWRALPAEARADLRAMGRERGLPGEPGPRPGREERRARTEALNARILDALRAEPFDAPGFSRLIDGDREALARRLDAAREAFATEVADLSPTERQAMADRLQEYWSEHARD
ncbi:periplasmic heavy metal sensor [Pararhodobacter aggregans]|uniref:Periplasmic heavy metal sensor n=1 Tax=Pararhodobacter aggregans TaxID=404875 RepID=A0A2T7UMB3_9RHOB|nr:periplasmic heavy metal sensor [Pararhodobacter aggregans]PTW99118.1 putative membrane protein [Pararhodobacter aggregans]PVE45842.1 hypothetical protein DDE23_18655 [Pararhodobacter aggregans]